MGTEGLWLYFLNMWVPLCSRRKGITHMYMKRYALAAGLLFAGMCAAKEHSDYQKGTLLRMDSRSCGMQEKGSKSLTGELLGTDGQSKKTQEMLSALKKGDRVVTQGGIYGTVQGVEPDVVYLKIAETVKVKVARSAITSLVSAETGE